MMSGADEGCIIIYSVSNLWTLKNLVHCMSDACVGASHDGYRLTPFTEAIKEAIYKNN